jgi:hypothetical protein
MPYELSVWYERKVLSIEWQATGEARLISFRRGDWERGADDFLRLSYSPTHGAND